MKLSMTRETYIWAGLVAALMIVAAALRLWHIDVQSLSHPEIYIPGIELLPGISTPPPRHDWETSIWWHFHDEPHAMGYYLGMKVWTDIAGTSEFALRVPGAILGILSIPAIALVTSQTYGRTAGLLAALFLTLHGFHIFWSQMARMYAPSAFVGLISILILLHLSQLKRASRPWEIAYILCALVGTLTFEFFWPFLFLQVAWVTIILSRDSTIGREILSLRQLWYGSRLAQVQSIALMISTPTLLHAVYRARGAAPGPNLEFLQEYFSFGFILARNSFGFTMLEPGVVIASLALVACLCLAFYSFSCKVRLPEPILPLDTENAKHVPGWVGICVALVVVCFMAWLTSIAHRRNELLAVVTLLPIVTLALPGVVTFSAVYLRKLQWISSINLYHLLFVLLGLLGPLVIFVISFVMPLLAPRAFLIFVPYLLIICAAGLMAVPGGRLVRAGAVVVVVSIFVVGAFHSSHRLGSPQDYKGLAHMMLPEMNDNDIVFIRHKHWEDTPFFYYLPHATYFTRDFEKAVAENKGRRIWLVTWPHDDEPLVTDARFDAVNGLTEIKKVTALRASAQLYEN